MSAAFEAEAASVVERFSAIPMNRLFVSQSRVLGGRLSGPLAQALQTGDGSASAVTLLMTEYAEAEWRVMARLDLAAGPVFGPMGPSDFIALWTTGAPDIERIPLTLACAVVETVFLSDCLQPCLMRFDEDRQTFLHSPLLFSGHRKGSTPHPRKLPAFLRTTNVLQRD